MSTPAPHLKPAKGGSMQAPAKMLRGAERNIILPKNSSSMFVGFRVVLGASNEQRPNKTPPCEAAPVQAR